MYSEKENSIALISLPWAPINSPTLALGQLKSVLSENGIHCQNFYCSNMFYKFISTNTIEQICRHFDILLTDWFFSRYAFGLDHDNYLSRYMPNADWVPLRDLFEKQLEDIANYDWSKFAYVGLTCTFNQIVSSLALSRRIKELHPDVTIVLGGDRIDAEIGHEFIQKIPWIDWVIVGEGEKSLVAAIKNHQTQNSQLKVPGLITRESYTPVVPLTADEFDALPVPDFDEFYAENPSTEGVWELSRGCWYGDKNLCTFCGMVPDAKYKIRSNPIKTLRELKNRYNIKHLEFVDLLIPSNAIETVFCHSGHLGMTFEMTTRIDMIKHNEIHKLRTLVEGGLKEMYVGIESLHPKQLKMMRKGQLAIHCISFLKWAAFYGIRVDWKLLFGIPFDKREHYFELLETLKKIPHFSPPMIQPIMITKRSPYYKELRPLKVPEVYRYIYPEYLEPERIAHDFEYVNSEYMNNKIKNLPAIDRIISYVEYWNNIRSNSSLSMNSNVVMDNRHGRRQEIKINDEQVDILNFCSISRKSHEVFAKFSSDSVQRLCKQDLLLELDQRLITLVEPQSSVLEDSEESLIMNDLIQLVV